MNQPAPRVPEVAEAAVAQLPGGGVLIMGTSTYKVSDHFDQLSSAVVQKIPDDKLLELRSARQAAEKAEFDIGEEPSDAQLTADDATEPVDSPPQNVNNQYTPSDSQAWRLWSPEREDLFERTIMNANDCAALGRAFFFTTLRRAYHPDWMLQLSLIHI